MTTELERWEDPDRLRDFAEAYAKSGSATVAIQRARLQNPLYRMAVWADRLLARDDVQAMIAEAEQRIAREKASKVYTRETIAEDFQDVYERAMEEGELTPAVSAKKAQAELLGLMEKNVNVTFTGKVTEMPMEALEAELARLVGDGIVTLEKGEDGVYAVP